MYSTKPISKIADFKNGKKFNFSEGPIPVYGGNGILTTINENNAENCVVIGRVGAQCGSLYYVPNKCWISDNAIVAKELTDCNKFLYYLLKTCALNTRSIGSGQPLITQGILNDISARYPNDIVVKRTIEKMLSAFDDKIEKNTEHIVSLTLLIQTLYQSWFSDFNYPTATNEMRESETLHKEVPKGWKEMKFGEFLAPHSEKIGDVEAPIYSTTNNGIALRDEKFNKNLSKSQKNNKKIVKDDLIFGLSREILNFGVVTEEIGSVSPVYQIFKIDQTVFLPFLLELEIRINMPNYMDILQLGAREGQGISKDYLLNKYILVPDMEVQKRFAEIYTVIKNKIAKLKEENVVLAEIRDTLLPKLMNGELPVEEGEE